MNPYSSSRESSSSDDAIEAFAARRRARDAETAARPRTKLEMLAAEKDAQDRAERSRSPRLRGRVYDRLSSSREGSWLRPAGLLLGAAALVIGPSIVTDVSYGQEEARDYVEEVGYTNVTNPDTDVVLVGLRGCEDSDRVSYRFEATAPNGVSTNVLVCKGLFKAATIRQG